MKDKKTLFYRQRLLLSMLQVFGGKLSRTELQKYLFLFIEICQEEEKKSYDFVPYHYGAFSFQSYYDIQKLIQKEILKVHDGIKLATEEDYLATLTTNDQKHLISFRRIYTKKRGDELIKFSYKEFPYFAINSKIASQKMSVEELKKIDQERPTENSICLFTIGYEGISLDSYLNKLIENNIKLLCDVRSNPISRKQGFSQKSLEKNLRRLGIEYAHIPNLGIESEKRIDLDSNDAYQKLFDIYEKDVIMNKMVEIFNLLELVENKHRVAITCFEYDENNCHRSRIAKLIEQLPEWKYEIKHI